MTASPRPVGTPRRLRAVGLLSCVALLAAGAPAVADARTSAREARALALLERAVRAARTVGYTGTHYVASWSAGASTSTLADVQHDPARGSVVPAAATNGAGGTDPGVVGPSRLDRQLLAVLAEQYDLVVAGDGRCAGRAAAVVEARRAGVDGAGAVAGRLWLDHDSGLLLRREVYDDAGRRVRSSAFVDLDVTSGAVSGAGYATQPVTAGERAMRAPVAALRADLDSGLSRLRQHGWHVPDGLPRGLVLFDVRLRDGAAGADAEPALAHLSYSDGLSTVSLFAQRGALGAGPGGGFRQTSMGGVPVWVHDATPSRVVWSGGGQVWTLVSDAPAEAVEATVLSLPHDPPADDGLLPRLARGLGRLGSALNPFS